MGIYRPLGKRLLDFLVAILGLIILSPLVFALICTIALAMGFPVFFRQRRPGHQGLPLTIIKFRTMICARGSDGRLLPDSERLHPLGRLLRLASLDEIPTLYNVLRGDMSLVGPRPLLMEYLPLYTPQQARRHEVKPGITGWAQVNGRNALSWEEKFKLDVWYVDHVSFWLDMKILWMTLWKVLKREGISAEGHATMPEFMGSEEKK